MRLRQNFQYALPARSAGRGMLWGPWQEEPKPILAWAIEHPDGVVLVDTGEHAAAHDAPFARFSVGEDDELGPRLRAAGIDPADVRTVILTHLHGDHVDGLPHVPNARVYASAEELRTGMTTGARLTRRIVRQPLPDGFRAEPVALDGPPVGAFSGLPRAARRHGARRRPRGTRRDTCPSSSSATART